MSSHCIVWPPPNNVPGCLLFAARNFCRAWTCRWPTNDHLMSVTKQICQTRCPSCRWILIDWFLIKFRRARRHCGMALCWICPFESSAPPFLLALLGVSVTIPRTIDPNSLLLNRGDPGLERTLSQFFFCSNKAVCEMKNGLERIHKNGTPVK